MPSKLQTYTALAEEQSCHITGSRDRWTNFLTTAGRLYKYPYEEQLIIHAQRPDATACAPLEMWNKPMNRYVRRGSKGIALIDNTGDKPRLRYVFDVSDTIDGRYNPHRPYIWEMKPEHETAIIDALSNAHDTGNVHEKIGDLIFGLAHELSTRYYKDHKSDIIYSTEDSFLEDYDEFNISVAYREALTVSAAYCIMKRCGIDTAEYISDEDFQPIFDFNTADSVNALGNGVSAVSEDVLREIGTVIKNYEWKRITERSNEHEQSNIQPERGLSDPQHHAGGNYGSTWQVRNDAEELSEGTPSDSLLSPDPERTVVFPLFRNRADSEREVSPNDGRLDETVSTPGQTDRADGLDSSHEQPESTGGENDSERPDLQLNTEDSETLSLVGGVSASENTITNDEIDTYLTTGSGTQDGKYRIYSFFLHEHSPKEKADFLKNEYGYSGRSYTFLDGQDGHIDCTPTSGIKFTKGEYFNKVAETTLTWTKAVNRIDNLIHDGLYMSEQEMDYLPSYERQMLGADIQNFFSGLPPDMPRPAEIGDTPTVDFWSNAVKIGNTLDNPETVANILAAMQPIMERTTASSHHYNTRKTAFDHLTDFSYGMFTLFPQRDTVQTAVQEPDTQVVAEPSVQMSLFPTESEQINFIQETTQSETTVLPVALTQADIDNLLVGSLSDNEREQILKQFKENPRSLAASELLKGIYSKVSYTSAYNDGNSGYIIGLLGEDSGMTAIIGDNTSTTISTREPAVSETLSWMKVHRRIMNLVQSERFLTVETAIAAEPAPELTDTPISVSEQEFTAETASSYSIGDTVYLEADRRFIIDGITDREVKLLDPSLYIPITRAMDIADFEREYYKNPRNEAEPPTVVVPPAPKAEPVVAELTIEAASTATTLIANFVKSRLEAGQKFNSSELFTEAAKAYGDTMANNTFTSKDAYDAMELGVNQYILASDNISVESMLAILELVPTQTRRTDGMEKFQQFSTPPSIAYLANFAANITPNDTVFEPSAGIGGIAIFAKKDGAKVYVNELDKRRLEIIKNLPFDGFYNEDAEQINNILGNKIQPTVIVMNPPFSSSAERNITNNKIGAKHIEEALKILAPNGRLVAIVGQGMADDTPAFRNWWREVKKEYNVKANIGIDGKNYNKYGTNFGIQMLVIDKDGPTIKPTKTAFVDNVLDLQTILGGIRNERPGNELENDNANEQRPVTATGFDTATERESEHERNDFISDTSGRTDTTVAGDRLEPSITSEIDTVIRGTSDTSPDLASINDNGTSPVRVAERHGGNDGRNDVLDGIGTNGAVDSGQSAGRVKPLVKPPKPAKTELTDSIFEKYGSQPLLLDNVQAHPANISESAAMSAIQPPPITYKPSLSQDIIDKGILSDVQLEAVSYAGQSHSHTLPDGNTRGFFLGDGTGVGKGRTITGIILDNYMQGRKKAVWLSENRGLVPDAKRDVKALFGNSDLVVEFQGGKKADASLSSDEAILFTTYSSLSKGFDQSGSNFEKIVNWLGKDFDGVIVFDEAHNMANSIATKGNRGIKKASQRGMAGLAIQEALPKAKIVYSSATGATEVENLRYAERLGLWGEGTAFPNGDDFVHRIKAGGLAAMELIARDMKAMGVYLSRNISYEDVIYDKIIHELTPEQRQIYDELARSWQIVLQNINKALETTNQDKDGMAKGKAYGAFWSAEQRFFNQILTAMQVPSMITDIQKQLDNDNSVVIQLVSTNEAAQEREFTRLQEQDLDLEDFDLTPKQMLMSYIENSFPTVQFEEYLDDNGNQRSKPVYDSEGNAVINREAVRQKEMLLDKLGSIRVPASALDMIINHFGSDMVAENTGRKRRVVVRDGKAREENIASKKEADVSAFQDGNKRIIVFSKAGGTGKSYHADKSAKNQQHRVHYLLQAGWQADAAVQGFGRSHRSNQVSAPTFSLVTTDLKGQMRFISTIAKRLDQLGALTKGQRQTGSQGLFTAGDNLENAFASDVLSIFYKALICNCVDGISDGVGVIEKLGLKDKLIDEYGSIIPTAPELREVNKFLNRILSLECHEQNAVFDGYAERLQIATEKAMQDGTLDKGLENYRADKVVLNETQDIKADDTTGAITKYYNLTAHNKTKPLQFNDIVTETPAFLGFYQSENTGAVRAVFKTSSMTDEYGNVTENCRLTGQDGNEYMPQNRLTSNWNKLTAKQAEKLWNDAVAELPEFRTSNLHLIGGTVLPVWDKLPTENVRIYRVLTTDGDLLIGRVIPEDMIDATLYRLGASREKEDIKTDDLIKSIKNGDTVHLDNDWRITQKRVSGEQRIEVIGPDYLHSDLLTKKGVFTERIAYSTRYFIPAENDTAKILDEILKISPVNRVENNSDRMAAKSYSAKEKPSILEILKQNTEKSRLTFGDRSDTDKKTEMSI